ncbi:uncharacterized protein METZ01_LOCUS355192, partial [marine metagenome]
VGIITNVCRILCPGNAGTGFLLSDKTE